MTRLIVLATGAVVALSVYALSAHHTYTTTHTPAGTCHARPVASKVLPDPKCTPGAVDASVTIADICPRAHTATERPSVDYTENLKRQSIKAYGYSDTKLSHYEADHLTPLELGGAPSDPKNIWAEPGASPNAKDRVENAAHDQVCKGRMTLPQAQAAISTDWVALGQQLGVK